MSERGLNRVSQKCEKEVLIPCLLLSFVASKEYQQWTKGPTTFKAPGHIVRGKRKSQNIPRTVT